jgi:hypothetical protein
VTPQRLCPQCSGLLPRRRFACGCTARGGAGKGWVTLGASLKWPHIVRMRSARYRLILDLRGHSTPQNIRVSWTRVHLGGERPWMHCPHCGRRVAKLYAGLGGYFCRACVAAARRMRASASARKGGPTTGHANCVCASMAQPSRQRLFRSARSECIVAPISGSGARACGWRRGCPSGYETGFLTTRAWSHISTEVRKF